MSIVTFSRPLETRLKNIVQGIEIDSAGLEKIGKTLALIRTLLDELLEFTSRNSLQNIEEEIIFFREIKPRFLSQYFLMKKAFEFKLLNSYNGGENQKAALTHELELLQQFAAKNMGLYIYYFSDSRHLDSDWFTSKHNAVNDIEHVEAVEMAYDIRLGTIMANEFFKVHILKSLETFYTGTLMSQSLSWTGSKTDLVELVYALESAHVFNNGAANIKTVASAFESIFSVPLGDFYRTFQSIRIRKKNQAAFLDRLKEKFIQRVDSLD